MLHNVYHMYRIIKILDKVGRTNKPNFGQPKYGKITESTLDNMMKVPSDIHDVQIQPYQV